eukprot:PhM_4_TR3357/c0_g1_i1/m.87493/K01921/ddl; D-alanine-D-alanine ligase
MSDGSAATTTTKKIRVCVLAPALTEASDFKDVDDYECTPGHYYTDAESSPYTFETVWIHKATSLIQLRALVASGKYDVYFNLCDGSADEDRAGEDVVRALETLNVPFTGSPSSCYDPTKMEMKMIAYYNNIKVPQYYLMSRPISKEELGRRTAKLRYPLIVKHPQGYSSIGLTKASKCLDLDQLYTVATEFVATHHRALIEEFIVGDEATVLSIESPDGIRTFMPVQVNFPEGEEFKHFDLKWVDYNGMEWKPVPESDPAHDEMKRVGELAFKHILHGVSFGRTDIRIDRRTNEVYFLEINPYGGVFYPPGFEASSDWILKLDPTTSHQDYCDCLIKSALKRHAEKQPLFEVTYEPGKGYHVVAARDIRKDTIVFPDEGRPMPIVTKPHVDATWSDADKIVFSQYAWPLSDDKHVYAIWQDDHTTWRPINHSCDPNIVFVAPHSLNCFARRDIAEGEELTMDYATFCDETMKPFECCCGAAGCRKIIEVTKSAVVPYGKNAWHRTVNKQ